MADKMERLVRKDRVLCNSSDFYIDCYPLFNYGQDVALMSVCCCVVAGLLRSFLLANNEKDIDSEQNILNISLQLSFCHVFIALIFKNTPRTCFLFSVFVLIN